MEGDALARLRKPRVVTGCAGCDIPGAMKSCGEVEPPRWRRFITRIKASQSFDTRHDPLSVTPCLAGGPLLNVKWWRVGSYGSLGTDSEETDTRSRPYCLIGNRHLGSTSAEQPIMIMKQETRTETTLRSSGMSPFRPLRCDSQLAS